MIFKEPRDPRFKRIHRGGTLTEENHRLLALWAAKCAEHVLHYFEEAEPNNAKVRRTIESAKAFARGEMTMKEARTHAGANSAARDQVGAARFAAYAAGQAVAVSHVPAHELGAAAYAIRAVIAAEGVEAGLKECQWQREQLPEGIRELVIDDQRLRNDACWNVFEC